MEEKTLATELLEELKKSAKRWFIIAIVLAIINIAQFCIYWLVPVEETSDEYNQGVTTEGNYAPISQNIEGD